VAAAGTRGFSLVELLFVSGFMLVMAAVAVPQSLVTLERSRAKAAARYLAARVALARAQAAKRSAYVALRFEGTGEAMSFAMFVDGNRNGVRARDIDARVDRPIDTRVRLRDMFPGVDIALSAAAGGGEGLRVGSSRMLSFSPIGTATSGTIYVRGRDDTQLAVRIFGATARTRVLRYEPRTREWVAF
jgi:type II secretory pathway pseudopilin PulG